MDAEWMSAALLVIDHTIEPLGHRSDAQAPDVDVITVAVVAANYFQNHHERASRVMRQLRSLSGSPRGSRCNRRQCRRTPVPPWSGLWADRKHVRQPRFALSERHRLGVAFPLSTCGGEGDRR